MIKEEKFDELTLAIPFQETTVVTPGLEQTCQPDISSIAGTLPLQPHRSSTIPEKRKRGLLLDFITLWR
jgi:hypothetical protein